MQFAKSRMIEVYKQQSLKSCFHCITQFKILFINGNLRNAAFVLGILLKVPVPKLNCIQRSQHSQQTNIHGPVGFFLKIHLLSLGIKLQTYLFWCVLHSKFYGVTFICSLLKLMCVYYVFLVFQVLLSTPDGILVY